MMKEELWEPLLKKLLEDQQENTKLALENQSLLKQIAAQNEELLKLAGIQKPDANHSVLLPEKPNAGPLMQQELSELLEQKIETIQQLLEGQAKQPVQFKSIRILPEFNSSRHYELLFRCIYTILGLILGFILLKMVLSYYFVKT